MKLGVCQQTVSHAQPSAVISKVNRIFVIDCSGSMGSELPKIRQQMKNKIPQLTSVGDTVSLIWFSSKGESGILQEAVEIKSLKSFDNLNQSIDRWIRPVGLTGFVDPLLLVNKIVDKVRGNGGVTSLMFLTDGFENQSSERDVLSAVKALDVDAVTFVEFGYYCNRALMIKMADEVGGNVVFNESFEQYDDTFTLLLTKPIKSGKKRVVPLNVPATFGYVYWLDNGDICSAIVENEHVSLSENVKEIYYIADVPLGNSDDTGVYAAVYTLSQRMLGGEALSLLGKLGDVRFIEMFTNCFSKQDYSEFQVAIKDAVFVNTSRFVDGQDFNAVPKEDAFTVLDMLDILANDEGNKFHPNSEHFVYERIGVKRDQKNATVTADEKELILEKIKLANTKDELEAANKELADLLAGKHELKFIPEDEDGGYNVDLVFNETRANVNIRVRIPGYVNLEHDGVPKEFATFIYRNYTMVKDGIKHSSMNCLPFELCKESFTKLQAEGLLSGEKWAEGKIFLIDVKKLPVINRKMATKVSAKEFFEMCAEMNIMQSSQKVFNTFYKNNFPYKSEGFALLYGDENAEWLKTIGITESNGFNPSSTKGAVTDVYTATEFNVKIAKCSSIPTINDKLIEKFKKTPEKLTLSESLCAPALKHCLDAIGTDGFKEMLETNKKKIVTDVRSYILAIAKIKFCILVGHVWFDEFASMDENSMTVNVIGQDFTCTAEVRNVEIEC